jgi:hypothetical protein
MWSERASSCDYIPPPSPANGAVAASGKTIAAREGKARWTSRPGLLRRAIGSMLVCVRPQAECRAQARARSAADNAYRAAGRLLRSVVEAQRPGARRNDVDLRARTFKRAIEALGAYRNTERASAEIMGALLRPATSAQLCKLKAGLAAAETGISLSGHGACKPFPDSVRLGEGFLVMACVLEYVEAEFARRITLQPLLDAAQEFEKGSVTGAAHCMVRLANGLAMFTADSSRRHYLVAHGMNALPAQALHRLARGFSPRKPLPDAATPLQRIVAETCGTDPADSMAARHADLLSGVRRALDTAIGRHIGFRLQDVANVLRVGCHFPEHLERSLEEAWSICEDSARAVGADLISHPGAPQAAQRLMLQTLAAAGPAAAERYLPLMTNGMLDGLVAAAAWSSESGNGGDFAHAVRCEQAARLARTWQVDYENLSSALDALGRAVDGRDKTAIANGLARLQPLRKAFSRSSTRAASPGAGEDAPPDPGGDTLQLRVHEVMGQSVSMLHSADDGKETIGPAGLRQLSNSAIADLRRAVAQGGLDIELKDEYLVPELQSRSEPFAQQVRQGLHRLIRVLAEQPVRQDDLVRALAAATQAAMRHIRRLSDLGDEVAGSDALADYAVAQVEQAVAALRDDALLRSSAAAVGQYVGVLQQVLQTSRNDVANFDDEEALPSADPLLHALNMLSIAGMLLHAVATTLDPACQTEVPEVGGAVAADKLGAKGPAAFAAANAAAFAAAFGIRLPAGSSRRSPLAVDRMQAASLHEALTFMPDQESGSLVPMDVGLLGNASRNIRVDSQFYLDAVQRPSVSFSFCKAGREQDVTRYAPEHGHPAITPPGSALGEALWRLYEMAGDRAVTLTRIMNQQLAAGLITALAGLGTRSPVTLDDGDCFLPGGPGSLDFDLQMQDDASFHILASISFRDMETGTRLVHPAAAPQSMTLVPALSHFTASFGMVLQPDGQALRMIEPVMFDYEVVQDTAAQ